MAFIQTIHGKNGPIYKVHYKEPLSGKRRCKNFSRMKAAQHFRDNFPKDDYLHSRDTVSVATAADKWLEVCEKVGRKGAIQEPLGHSSIKITYDVYGHPFRDHEDRRAERANQIMQELVSV